MPGSYSSQTQTQTQISISTYRPNTIQIPLTQFRKQHEDLTKPWWLRHRWTIPIIFGIEHEGEIENGNVNELQSCYEDCEDDWCDEVCDNGLYRDVEDTRTLEWRSEGTAHFEIVTKPIALTKQDDKWIRNVDRYLRTISLPSLAKDMKVIVEDWPIMFSNLWVSAGDHIHISVPAEKASKLRRILGNLTPLTEVMTWSGLMRSRRWYELEFTSSHYSFVGYVSGDDEYTHFEYRVPSASPIQIFWELIVLIRDLLEANGKPPSKGTIIDDMLALTPIRDLLNMGWSSERTKFAWTVLLFEGILRLKNMLGLTYVLPPLLSWAVKNQLPPIFYYLKKVGLSTSAIDRATEYDLARYLRRVTLLSYGNYDKYSNDIFPELERERITIAEALVILKKAIRKWIEDGNVIPITSVTKDLFPDVLEALKKRVAILLDNGDYYRAYEALEKINIPELNVVRWAINNDSIIKRDGKFYLALARATKIDGGVMLASKVTGRDEDDIRGAFERVWVVVDRKFRAVGVIYSRWADEERTRVRIEIPENLRGLLSTEDLEMIRVAVANNHRALLENTNLLFINPQ